LLRYSSGHLVVFEAIGETGVTLTDWADFIDYKWHLHYEKIVYRKLYCERTTDLLEKLEQFIKVTQNTITVMNI
jgi:hypothetical protein